ncbi:MAG: hypothetical protein IK066_11260 [Kiritimatiellae bacterium]|nr:hypothetical protein [Kiritimatiellia bacterium]
MGRLPGHDYRRPDYYMVTLKKRAGVPDFSALAPPGAPPPRDAEGRECWLAPNVATRAFSEVIRGFAGKWRGIAPVKCFAVMPDHLHLLLKIEDTPDRLPLGTYVFNLERALARAFWKAVGGTGAAVLNGDGVATASASGRAAPVPPVFEHDWHDWIVMKRGQLNAFTRYILENPRRAWLRRENRQFFTRPGKMTFAGREWFSYGNPALLELPVLEPFRCSRSWNEDGPEWREALARAARIGPGGAGVGTFLSPCEKACGNAICKAGGSFVVLSPEGFPDRWHPSRAKEKLCAEGRMLFLSLWPSQPARLDNATLHHRCHEMGDAILAPG